jgi:pyruvate kinase
MALHYGVIPQEMAPPDGMTALVSQVDTMIRERKFADDGQRIIVVAGAAQGTPGTMNGVIIHTVGEVWTERVQSAISLADASTS